MKIPFQQYWDLLAKYIWPQKRQFFLLAALLLSSIGMQLINPQIMRYFIDTTQKSSQARELLIAALAFISIAIIQQVVGVSATYLGENVAWTATNALRAEMARHCLDLDMSYHNNVSPGELIERIDGDVAELSNFFSQLVVRVLGNLLLLFGILIAFMLVDWRIGLAFSFFAVLTLLALNAVRGIAIPYQKKFREYLADLFGYLEERLAGTEDIRSSGAVDFALLGIYKHSKRIFDVWRSVHAAVCARALHRRDADDGGRFDGAGGRLLPLPSRADDARHGLPDRNLHQPAAAAHPRTTQQVENLQNIGAATERLRELRAIQTKIEDGPGDPIQSGALSLAFENVHFGYKEGEPVLEQIDFQIQPGTVMGILGRTGSGKTTLARLIFRLYDPNQGCILLGGVPLTRPNLKGLRERVALVTQDVQLFQASVRDNITFFDRSIPDDKILAVIGELGLTEWLAGLPDGLDTKLHTGGRSSRPVKRSCWPSRACSCATPGW